MSTFIPKISDIKRSWHVVDASDLSLGRLSAQVASILRGKVKPIFMPHVDCGDYVIVINCDKILLKGRKLEKKVHQYHTGYIGGLKTLKYSDIMKNSPCYALELAVKGMLPKNTLGRKQFLRLKPVVGSEHKFSAQKPQPWTYIRKERNSA